MTIVDGVANLGNLTLAWPTGQVGFGLLRKPDLTISGTYSKKASKIWQNHNQIKDFAIILLSKYLFDTNCSTYQIHIV